MRLMHVRKSCVDTFRGTNPYSFEWEYSWDDSPSFCFVCFFNHDYSYVKSDVVATVLQIAYGTNNWIRIEPSYALSHFLKVFKSKK